MLETESQEKSQDNPQSNSTDSDLGAYQYSGFWRRFAALFIDGLILLIPHLILNNLLPVIGPVVLTFLYKPVFESSPIRATPGKAILGMVVITEEGDRLSFRQAIVRFCMSFVSGIFFCAGYLLNLFTLRRQTLHDLVAHTVVIDQEMPRENFFDIWVNQMRVIFGRNEAERFSSSSPSSSDAPSSWSASSSTHSGPSSFRRSRETKTGEADSAQTYTKTLYETDAVVALEKLHKLYSEGVITEAEFNQKKTEILKRI